MPSIAQPASFDESSRTCGVAGLTYVANAVTADDERALARFVESLEFKPFE